ncbi:MAG: Cys-tRNA(Pro) deacylase [Oscillospiraceae bacterium]|nr:Cys-tRNA(Pro) deacylase [Oscillospiraceae bacterium]
MEKTNVMRILDQKKLEYTPHFYDNTALNGEEIAHLLNQKPQQVFKTLVTVGKSKKNYVFMIPVCDELDLKKAAKTAGEKSVEMIKSKELLPLTGYIHGGCSPIGMKKLFTTFIHNTAETFEKIYFSGGKVGCQVETSFENLKKAVPVRVADLTIEK